MAFEWHRIHKWEDNLYNYANEWVEEYIFEYYGVDEITDLTEQQISEIQDFMETDLDEYSPLRPGFYNLVNWWENEQ